MKNGASAPEKTPANQSQVVTVECVREGRWRHLLAEVELLGEVTEFNADELVGRGRGADVVFRGVVGEDANPDRAEAAGPDVDAAANLAAGGAESAGTRRLRRRGSSSSASASHANRTRAVRSRPPPLEPVAASVGQPLKGLADAVGSACDVAEPTVSTSVTNSAKAVRSRQPPLLKAGASVGGGGVLVARAAKRGRQRGLGDGGSAWPTPGTGPAPPTSTSWRPESFTDGCPDTPASTTQMQAARQGMQRMVTRLPAAQREREMAWRRRGRQLVR